ncbi:hypothetical protein F6X40_09360 [Paraburkholderia sp. UCT31]|uniref:glyoxalase superfamily protein n=1 Tax=Paraburkholderia sp. UCT31 TaxID=2615209 RepID=UPI0016558E0D|nr:glyoxalase superfamily protein [Paraburkholderia sp. UCT31]MBC8737015.1 hypothetical protein [Paraburkholderia sp. UCT31]
MQVEVNVQVVKEMARRLRAAQPAAELSIAQSLELAAKAFGHPNWDTLSGMLRREVVAKPRQWKLKKPQTLFIDVRSDTEFGAAPSWVKVEVDQSFVDEVLDMHHRCNELSLDHCARDFDEPVQWGGEDVEALNIQYPRLFADKYRWWLRAKPKHDTYHVESFAMRVEDFLSALKNEKGDERFAFFEDEIVFSAGEDVKALVNELVECGEL